MRRWICWWSAGRERTHAGVSGRFAARTALLLLALLLSSGALAGNARQARKQAEASMLVSGWVMVRTDGSVESHEVYRGDRLSPELAALVADAAAQWRFEPIKVDGKVVTARIPMHVRLIAKAAGEGRYTVAIRSAVFGSLSTDPEENVSRVKVVAPEYPRTALRMGGKGTVYLLLRIGRDGRVLDVATEQVNLTVAGTSQQMDQLRSLLSQASERAAKQWEFKPPTRGPDADAPHWVVRCPVAYRFAGEMPAEVGEWETYIPGPRNYDIPWVMHDLRLAGSPDALPDGALDKLDQGPRLLNPPGGNG